ncbi:MAG: hypothetical protein CMO01_08420 [Thalassobius sp.]|nr:hypothetical protein [Thalassovita sp.]
MLKLNSLLKIVIGLLFLAACNENGKQTSETVDTIEKASVTSTENNDEPMKKMLRHVVLFKFKEGTTDAEVKEIEEAFKGLKEKIDVIKDFEWGTDVSVENKSEGFTHCFFVTFADEAGREVYLPHPDHKAFGQVAGPHIEKVLVFDYWVKN